MITHFLENESAIWGAHASRVLTNASSRSRTSPYVFRTARASVTERLFRRDAETNTRDACAPRNTLHT
jgi:hypothetical protein